MICSRDQFKMMSVFFECLVWRKELSAAKLCKAHSLSVFAVKVQIPVANATVVSRIDTNRVCL